MAYDHDHHADIGAPVERREGEIAALTNELNDVYGRICEVASELDGQLAGFDYLGVHRSIDALDALVRHDAVLEQLAELVAAVGSATQEAAPVGDRGVPYLDADGLPSRAVPDDVDVDDRREALVDALRNRVKCCADHLRGLCRLIEECWEAAIAAAAVGDVAAVSVRVAVLRTAVWQARCDHDLWQAGVAELFEQSPASLGWSGETLHGFASWQAAGPGAGGAGRCP